MRNLSTPMRELSDEEVAVVDGGVAPLVLAAWFTGGVTTYQFGKMAKEIADSYGINADSVKQWAASLLPKQG